MTGRWRSLADVPGWLSAVVLVVLVLSVAATWWAVATDDEVVVVPPETVEVRDVQVEVREVTIVVVVAGSIGSLIAYLWPQLRYLVALYSLIGRGQLLDHDLRERATCAIRDDPGRSISELADHLGTARKTLVYHLARLERAGFVRSVRSGRRRRFYPGDAPASRITQDAAQANALANPIRRALLAAVEARPGQTQKELRLAAGLSSPLASWHLGRLEACGLVRTEGTGSNLRYMPVDPPSDAPA